MGASYYSIQTWGRGDVGYATPAPGPVVTVVPHGQQARTQARTDRGKGGCSSAGTDFGRRASRQPASSPPITKPVPVVRCLARRLHNGPLSHRHAEVNRYPLRTSVRHAGV